MGESQNLKDEVNGSSFGEEAVERAGLPLEESHNSYQRHEEVASGAVGSEVVEVLEHEEADIEQLKSREVAVRKHHQTVLHLQHDSVCLSSKY